MMKRLFLMVLFCLALIGFAQPVLANGDVTLNVTYIGPGGIVEGDFVGFKFYRDAVLIHTTSDGDSSITWIDADVANPPAEGYAYKVVAYESEGIDGPEWSGSVFWGAWPGGLKGSIEVNVIINNKN